MRLNAFVRSQLMPSLTLDVNSCASTIKSYYLPINVLCRFFDTSKINACIKEAELNYTIAYCLNGFRPLRHADSGACGLYDSGGYR